MSILPERVQSAVDALASWRVSDFEQARELLSSWKRINELDEAEADFAARAAVDIAAPPAGRDPEWCTIDHAEDDARDDLVLHTGDEHTDGTVRRLLDVTTLDNHAHGGAKLDIRVMRTDSLTEGRIGTPVLRVHATDVEVTTWEQAAELARTILDAFGYLKGA